MGEPELELAVVPELASHDSLGVFFVLVKGNIQPTRKGRNPDHHVSVVGLDINQVYKVGSLTPFTQMVVEWIVE